MVMQIFDHWLVWRITGFILPITTYLSPSYWQLPTSLRG